MYLEYSMISDFGLKLRPAQSVNVIDVVRIAVLHT